MLKAEKLIMMTNIAGVLDKTGNLLTDLIAREIDEMFADGTISGGMLPKISSALDAAKNGVNTVHIIDGRVAHAMLLEVLTEQAYRHEHDPLALIRERPPRGSAPVWLFDLDNTLHDASHAAFDPISESMTSYIAEHLGLAACRRDRAAPGTTGTATARRCSAWCATTACVRRTSSSRRTGCPGLEAASAHERAAPRRAAGACPAASSC